MKSIIFIILQIQEMILQWTYKSNFGQINKIDWFNCINAPIKQPN